MGSYLRRYSHRTALSDSRLLSLDGESVELSYKDYRDGDQRKVMMLSGEELLRRFLLHVLQKTSCACAISASWPIAAVLSACRPSARRPARCKRVPLQSCQLSRAPQVLRGGLRSGLCEHGLIKNKVVNSAYNVSISVLLHSSAKALFLIVLLT